MTKGKDFEAEYFIHENSESKHRLLKKQEQENKLKKEAELKALHHMKCSKCGHDLKTKRMTYIDIDQCSNCGAIVLSPDDVDKFIAEEKSILKKLIDFFN